MSGAVVDLLKPSRSMITRIKGRVEGSRSACAMAWRSLLAGTSGCTAPSGIAEADLQKLFVFAAAGTRGFPRGSAELYGYGRSEDRIVIAARTMALLRTRAGKPLKHAQNGGDPDR